MKIENLTANEAAAYTDKVLRGLFHGDNQRVTVSDAYVLKLGLADSANTNNVFVATNNLIAYGTLCKRNDIVFFESLLTRNVTLAGVGSNPLLNQAQDCITDEIRERLVGLKVIDTKATRVLRNFEYSLIDMSIPHSTLPAIQEGKVYIAKSGVTTMGQGVSIDLAHVIRVNSNPTDLVHVAAAAYAITSRCLLAGKLEEISINGQLHPVFVSHGHSEFTSKDSIDEVIRSLDITDTSPFDKKYRSTLSHYGITTEEYRIEHYLNCALSEISNMK